MPSLIRSDKLILQQGLLNKVGSVRQTLRYEGMALNARSKKTRQPRSARVRGLGAPAWSLFWGWHVRRSRLSRAMVLGARRDCSATAPASLAQVVGASPMGACASVAVTNTDGVRVALVPAWFAQPGAMPPCSRHHRRASATASHND